MKLEGFGIFVKDMPTMVRFYRDVLGFEIKEEEDSSNVYLVKDGTYEIAMGVENYAAVDDTFKRVVSNGAVPVLEPTTEPWGQRTCYVADPEGNLIEIGSFTK